MSTLEKILPRESTDLEKALTAAVDAGGRLRLDLAQLAALRANPPDAWLPWLLRGLGLDELLDIVPARTLWTQGREWERRWGTPWAIRKGVSWAGYTVALEEEDPLSDLHWVEQQLGPDRVPQTLADVQAIVRLWRRSKALWQTDARMFAGYDVRPGIGDESLWDDALFDDWSGVLQRPDWPVLSFGLEQHGHTIRGDRPARVTIDAGLSLHTYYEDVFRFDVSQIDQFVDIPNRLVVLGSALPISSNARLPNPEPPQIFVFSKTMIIFDDDQWPADDSINHVTEWSRLVEDGEPLAFDEGRIDVDGVIARLEPVDELFEQTLSIADGAAPDPIASAVSILAESALYAPDAFPFLLIGDGFVLGDSDKHPIVQS